MSLMENMDRDSRRELLLNKLKFKKENRTTFLRVMRDKPITGLGQSSLEMLLSS
jgi:hypothetical protein